MRRPWALGLAAAAVGWTTTAPALDVERFRTSDKILAGTDGRTEMEFKLAFQVDEDFTLASLEPSVRKTLEELINSKKMEFPGITHRDYRIDPEFQSFAFRDIYLDTPGYDILRANSAYRLRYRWSRLALFLRHQIFPGVTLFHPTRCEIQFKRDYSFDQRTVSVTETRFEFRNAAPPFNVNQDAPKPPWPTDEYLGYATEGVFRNYRIKPAHSLLEELEEERGMSGNVDISPAVELVSVRDRIHLRMKHPWGSGPNPEQVFIITLDKVSVADSEFTRAPLPEEQPGFLEVEVEIERNASTEIERMKNLADVEIPRFDGVKNMAVAYSRKAWDALVQDLGTLRRALAATVREEVGSKPLPPSYKYSRAARMLEKKLAKAADSPSPSAR